MTPHILVYTKCPTLYIKAAFTYSKINRAPIFQPKKPAAKSFFLLIKNRPLGVVIGLATGKSAIFTASRNFGFQVLFNAQKRFAIFICHFGILLMCFCIVKIYISGVLINLRRI